MTFSCYHGNDKGFSDCYNYYSVTMDEPHSELIYYLDTGVQFIQSEDRSQINDVELPKIRHVVASTYTDISSEIDGAWEYIL